ncbi:MAG: thioesterase family protein [Boseongicola sp.]|nr:thioesterase family protein [Boseongicola sp.]MDD9977338.1 thioesterase family protein [Boseongicola sp.]
MTSFLTQLSKQELSANGLDGFAYGYRDRVRFYELDALDHVNNVVFLKWFETIRVSYVQDYGFTSYTKDDPMLVVRRVTCDFLAPMFQNEEYVVATRTTVLKPSSFVMDYAVMCDGSLRATGEAVVVSLEQDGKTRRKHYRQAYEKIMELDKPAVPA